MSLVRSRQRHPQAFPVRYPRSRMIRPFTFNLRNLAPAIAMLLLAGCVLPPQHTRDYACPDGYEFSIRYSDARDPGDVALLEDESGVAKLPRAPAASGSRYSDGVTTFWEKGESAMILRGDEIIHADCAR